MVKEYREDKGVMKKSTEDFFKGKESSRFLDYRLDKHLPEKGTYCMTTGHLWNY